MSNAKHLGTGRGWWTGRGGSAVSRLTASLLVVAVAALSTGADAAVAKKPTKQQAAKQDDAAAPQRDMAAIQQAYAAGTKAYEAGDMAAAEQQLSIALAGGGLPNSQMARALYYRGSSYRQLGRPAQGISDLTTAVWLKGGLSGDDRTKAIEARQLAYREAGLGENAPAIGAAPLDQGGAPAAAPVAAPVARPGVKIAVVGQQSSFWKMPTMPTLPSLPSLSSITGSGQPAAAPAAAAPVAEAPAAGASPDPAAAAPVDVAAAANTSSWDTQTAASASSVAEAPQVVAGYAPAAAPAADATLVAVNDAYSPAAPVAPEAPAAAPQGQSWNPLAGTGAAVTGFFGNMFGSGSTASTAATSPVTTGSTASPDWGSETTVATAQTSSMVQRGPDAPADLPWTATQTSAPQAAAAPAPRKVASAEAPGRYKLQVAAVRSREEAERLAETLRGYHAVKTGVVAPEIDEAVIGSMGTFYRVRLGPYADATEPGQLCKSLRPQGFDCLVVTQ